MYERRKVYRSRRRRKSGVEFIVGGWSKLGVEYERLFQTNVIVIRISRTYTFLLSQSNLLLSFYTSYK